MNDQSEATRGAHANVEQINTQAAGLGIGLALVRDLVERHGGLVTAASRGLGHGSEFTISLPMQAE